MPVTPELSEPEQMAFQKIAQDTIKAGGTSQTAFMVNANKQGLTTSPRANKIWAESLYDFRNKKPVVSTEDVQNEIDQTNQNITDYTNQQQQKQQNKVAQDMYDKETKNKQIDETIDTYDDYLDSELKNTQDTFDSLYAQVGSASDTLIQAIKDQYALRTEEMKVTNKASLNRKSTSLGRSGAKRYASEQSTGVLTAEESAGINRIKSLAVEEAQLIAEAQLAKTAEQWKMFNEKREALTELNEKKVTALKDQLDLITKSNTIAEDEGKSALEKLQMTVKAQADIDPGLANQLDSLYGDGWTSKYATVLDRENKIAETGEDVALMSDIVELLGKVPEGQPIQIGDSTYTGTYSPEPNMQTWIKTTATGEYKVIKFNEDTNEVTVTGTGEKEKVTSTGGGNGTVKNILGLDTVVINGKTVPKDFEGHFGDDNRVDTDVYKNTRNKLSSASDRTLFDENYRYLLNPADPTAVDLALPKTFNTIQITALEAAARAEGKENWYDFSPSKKLEIITSAEKTRREELGIGTNNSAGAYSDDPFAVTTSTSTPQ